MTPDQRDKLLDLHRASVDAMEKFISGSIMIKDFYAADDAFRDYLFSLEASK